MKSRSLSATEFKAKCLRILEELEPRGITITKRGRPIAKVIPIPSKAGGGLYGCMKGKITVKGNIFSTGIQWRAQS